MINEQEAHDIAVDAYIYLYPLVTLDLTRKQRARSTPRRRWSSPPIQKQHF